MVVCTSSLGCHSKGVPESDSKLGQEGTLLEDVLEVSKRVCGIPGELVNYPGLVGS